MLFAFGIAAVLIFMVYMFGDEMVVLISGTSNPELISNAVFYLRFDLPFYFVLAVLLITRTTLQGMGAKFVPVIASVMELLLKVVTAKWLAAKLGYLGIAICEPVIWIVCAIFIIIVFRMQLKKNEAALQT
jgi:Na+-driven multidrug efflux pump